LLRKDCDLQLSSWCDFDWAGCPLTCRSLIGWFVLLGSSLISWKTKKQQTVSRSSTKVEYRSMAAITRKLKWLKGLLHNLGISHSQPMRLHCESQATLHVVKNPVFHERTKHVEVDCHFIHDEYLTGNIAPQLADIFTKALGLTQFTSLLCKLAICNLHTLT